MRDQRLCRRGTIVPLLAVTIIALFALVALAADIGLIALARNHCQNAADAAAMASVRVLNGDAASNNNYAQAAPEAVATAMANRVVGQPIAAGNVATEVGYYAYNAGLQRFDPHFTGSKPPSENWSAVRVTVNAAQPTFFARVLGFASMPVTATATAVHRPRDVAIVLDFSGSMKFSSEPAYPSNGDIVGSLNPDPVFPRFGHWSSMASVMQRSTIYVDSGGEAHAPNNMTMDTENGPAIVRDFLCRDSSGNFQNAFHRPTSPYDPMTWACPAPSDWNVQASTTTPYVGDLWPRFNRSLTTGNYAATVQEWLQGNNAIQADGHARSALAGPGGGAFDPVNRDAPLPGEGYGPNFKGYTMGPGYYGKTFYLWPPDPRYHLTNSTLQHDWRKKFFFNYNTTTPLGGNTPGADNRVDNSRLFDTSGYWRQGNQSTSYSVNYTAIVQWIKSGPKVLPDNLRAGRVLYYSAIPNTIPATGGTQDQRFWRAYIDYVIGTGSSTVQRQTLYGRHHSGWGTVRIRAKNVLQTGNSGPYMHYNDNPIRPRLHFWFGPLSMLTFLGDNNSSSYARNWLPGTCHESQCWQLKVGISSALADIQKNHPNDWVALNYFSSLDPYITPRVTLGRDYERMRNALFFPFNTLSNLTDPNDEIRPYDSNLNSTAAGNVPNANGGTSPETGFKVAYNQLSSRPGFNGRRGAAKVVIFETDGVPNTPTTGSTANQTWVAGTPAAYHSWYTGFSTGSFIANNDPGVVSRALTVVQTICNLDTDNPPGYSTPRMPARVHAIAFGDLFQSGSTRRDQALQFLLDVQKIGSTSAADATSIESYKIITGDYTTRIENMRQALERIMQSGVQVSLIR